MILENHNSQTALFETAVWTVSKGGRKKYRRIEKYQSSKISVENTDSKGGFGETDFYNYFLACCE
jgi:hypothetical protein